MNKKSRISKELFGASIFIGAFFIFFLGVSSFWYLEDAEKSNIYDHTLMKIPKGFNIPQIPSDNYPNLERVALGKRLFFDTITSRTNKLGCFSCHVPHKAMGDTGAISVGVDGKKGFRNTPTIANIAYHNFFMKDGGVPTLEMQLLVPISDTAELDFNIVHIGGRMEKDSSYVNSSLKTYNKDPSYYAFVVSRSISCFQRILISGNSSYDQYYFHNKLKALTNSQKRGLNLFMSDKLKCSKCHSGFNFSNNTLQNNGLYMQFKDKGRGRVTLKGTDNGKFKVPTLRNIEMTAPYMHDGSMSTLETVINHYSSGGYDHNNKSELIKGFEITDTEKTDLINFLKSLTDNDFIEKPY